MKSVFWLLCLTGIYGAILLAITALNWISADRFWLGALNLYLPQVMWTVPGIVLAFLVFRANPVYTWLPLLCVLWVLGPVMGFRWSLDPPGSPAASVKVRVLTWNIKYGKHDLAPLVEEIDRCKPDVVLFQDAVDALNGPLGNYFKNWQVRSHEQFVIASRYPLSQAEVFELPSSSRKREYFLRCRLTVGSAEVSLYNVHLKTPRRSLNALRGARRQPGELPEAVQSFDRNVRTRLLQATSLQEHLSREQGPVIMAGDLNAPDSSLICATLRDAGLHDAFAERGKGYGSTYGHFLFKHRLPWLKVSWMRIDHIMVSSGIVTRRCWAGSAEASDHRPVIADLILRHP